MAFSWASHPSMIVSYRSMHFSYVEYNGEDELNQESYLWHHLMFFCWLEFTLIIMNAGKWVLWNDAKMFGWQCPAL